MAAQGSQHSPAAQDPAILVVCTPSTGHVIPMLQIVSHLVSRGYDVWFVTAPEFRAQVERTRARFIPALKSWNFSGVQGLHRSLVSDHGPYKDERMMVWVNALYKEVWARNIPPSLESIRRAMLLVRQAVGPERDVVMMVETWTPGIIPLKLGAELPEGYDKMPKTLGVSVIPPQISTLEQGPMIQGGINTDLAGCLGVPHPDGALARDSDAMRARNAFLARLSCAALAPTWETFRFVMRMCGASEDYQPLLGDGLECPQIPSNISFLGHDTTLQMCIPSLEYEARWPAHVKFGGTLPPKPVDHTTTEVVFPEWYEDMRREGRAGTGARKFILVTQGTVAVDYTMCVVPTIRGLAESDNVTVIATLGRKGASLDKHFPEGIPKNAIVVDYFPYDPLLRHVDLVVTNGSYGIFSQCAAYGVPMVAAGAKSEDKPEVC